MKYLYRQFKRSMYKPHGFQYLLYTSHFITSFSILYVVVHKNYYCNLILFHIWFLFFLFYIIYKAELQQSVNDGGDCMIQSNHILIRYRERLILFLYKNIQIEKNMFFCIKSNKIWYYPIVFLNQFRYNHRRGGGCERKRNNRVENLFRYHTFEYDELS